MASLQRFCRAPLLTTLLLIGLFCPPAQATDPTVRVLVLDQYMPQQLLLSSHGGRLAFYVGEGETAITELAPGAEAILSIRGEELFISLGEEAFFALSLRLRSLDDALMQVTVSEGASPPGPRRYPGELTISVNATPSPTLKLINALPLEDYVAAVVTSEFGFDDLESAKAVAVAVRTYTLQKISPATVDYDHVDHILSQQYEGVGRVTPTALEATRQTRGEVLTYQGALIDAVYFASSGGHTADNEVVWNTPPLPYLRGVQDPYDRASPYHQWQSTVDRRRLLDLLSQQYGFAVEGLLFDDRSRDGRIQTVELLKNNRPARSLSGTTFRVLINQHFGTDRLRSTFFSAKRRGDQYVFEGQGYGHGVGLNQLGALEMSQQGHSYHEILAYYYTDVHSQMYGASAGLPLTGPDALPSIPSDPTDLVASPTLKVTWAETLPSTMPKAKKTTTRRIGW